MGKYNDNISIKSTDSEDELMQYFGYNITGRDNMSAIVFDSTMDEIISFLSEYIEDNVSIYKKIENDDVETYLISKITDREGKISLIIEPFEIWDENIDEYVYKNVDDEFVMIEEGILYDKEIELNIYSDKIVQVGLKDGEDYDDEEDEDIEDDCDCCNECDNRTSNDDIDEENPIDILLDEYVERIQELGFVGCPHCLMELLEELHIQSYKEGLIDELLMQNEISSDRLFGEDGLLN